MRILITGGAGFLGSHLCDALIAQGHEVVCMDNFVTGRPENIAHLMGHERFSFVKYNVCDYLHIDGPLDAVMHFASPASPQDYLELPIATLKVGALGTHKALGLAKAKGARFLLASTSEVYGDPLVNPQPESYWGNVNPISPRGVYDEAKRFAEALTMAYHRYHGLDTRIVRIFNTYGPRMRPHDGRVVSNFIVQALQGKPLTVFGDGTQTRSFCYVDDLIRGIVALLGAESDKSVDGRTDRARFFTAPSRAEPAGIHDPVNLGNPRELTVQEIAQLVLKLTGSSSAIQRRPLPVDDPKVRRPDIRRAKALLGWEPTIELEDGLQKTIEYFRQVL
jgi:dTDP-glucose 4,6-dehydratase